MYHGIKNHLRNKGKGNIVKRKGSIVYGVIYKVTKDILKKLDVKEGVNNNIYEREYCKIHSDKKTYKCITYRMLEDTIYGRMSPSNAYRKRIMVGALNYNFPNKYLDRLNDK